MNYPFKGGGWAAIFEGLIVFMGCSVVCAHALFLKKHIFSHFILHLCFRSPKNGLLSFWK